MTPDLSIASISNEEELQEIAARMKRVEQTRASNVRLYAMLFCSVLLLSVSIDLAAERAPIAILVFKCFFVVASAICVFLVGQPRHESLTSFVIVSGTVIGSIPSIFFNGGFSDPRTSLAILTCVTIASGILGLKHSTKVLFVGIFTAFGVVLLDHMGVMSEIQNNLPSSDPELKNAVSQILTATTFIGLGLNARLIKTYVTELEDFAKVTAHQANTDALTELASRRHFHSRMNQELKLEKRYGSPASLMIIDLDYFKEINDTYGHLDGDSVLKGVASEIKDAIRETDVAARYGGDEFAVFLPRTEMKEAELLADRILDLVRAKTFELSNGSVKKSTTVTIGVATTSTDTSSPDDLIAHADKALYAAKEAGRNQFACYQNGGSIKTLRDLSGTRVLCVDASNITLREIHQTLNKAGATVATCRSEAEALDLIRASDFDIIFTDTSTTDVDGEQLQRTLKEWKLDLPVVAVTDNETDAAVDSHLADGYADSLDKRDIQKMYAVVEAHALRRS